jgi:L-ribulokinase
MLKYCLGIDFGTLSGRAVLVEVNTGNIVATAVKSYAHGVMDEYLPYGQIKLPHAWALQHPGDYIEVLEETIPAVLSESGIPPEKIVGMAIDFTACTVLPIDKEGRPLCFKEEFKTNPHSYVKLWKHHGAQSYADKLNEIASEREERFLHRYGGKISSEWLVPKIMEILNEAPEVYNETDKFIEAGDWISLLLTGNERRNSCAAGYKALWNKTEGYPSKDFFKALDFRLENFVDEKLSRKVYPQGAKAGELTKEMAKQIGLIPGIAVAVSNIDGHVAVPAVGIVEPGKMLIIMGTSACHMVLDKEEKIVPGMCGVVEDGIIPGLMGYEAGQPCVGDNFEWFINNCLPESYAIEAKKRNINIHKLLREKAMMSRPGENGLIVLDWWNGNRSVLVDANLSGLIVGLTLSTKPEEIYRALIEATAFGTYTIIESFEKNKITIDELYACGGIAEKDEFMMQIYADVTGREIKISASPQTAALGSAMFGAVAAGKEKGGYDTIFDAAKYMSKVKKEYYKPNPENVKIYKKLYTEYKKLHDYFGRGENNVMKILNQFKINQS